LSFLLSIEGMLGTAFVAGLVLGFLLPMHWKAVAAALTALAAAYAAVRIIAGEASSALDIIFAALWAAIGAFPGAALGSWISGRLRRSA
jgi:uncharacterized membrane protein YfcA